jgi:catechol 2,3-dioxygenase-like lactoylglutathione lyase family enzyme
MTITLDHTIVPSHDHDEAARFFARIFGLDYHGAGHFAPVRVNEHLTLDFAMASGFEQHHYAFVVGEAEFDEIFARITSEGLVYGSGPSSADDGKLNHRRGGRGLYFRGGPDPHLWEIMTTPETGS